METYKEKHPGRQDALLPEDTDALTHYLHELVICARCLGRYIKGGYSDSELDLPPDFIAGEEAVTENLIRYFLEEGRQIRVTIGDVPIIRMDARGLFRPEEVLLISEVSDAVDGIPLVGSPDKGFISIEDFCSNLYYDGIIELL